MNEDDLEACYHDTSRILADWHKETGVAFHFRVYEQPAIAFDGETCPLEWTVEVRLGADRHSLNYIVTLPVESWKLTRETPDAWRDLVLEECYAAARALRKAAAS